MLLGEIIASSASEGYDHSLKIRKWACFFLV